MDQDTEEAFRSTFDVNVIRPRSVRLFRRPPMRFLLYSCSLVVFLRLEVDGGKIYPPGIFIEAQDMKPIFKPNYQPRKLFIEPHSNDINRSKNRIFAKIPSQRTKMPLFRSLQSNSEGVLNNRYGLDILSRKSQRKRPYAYASIESAKAVDRNDHRHQSIKMSQESDIWDSRLPNGCYRNDNGYLCCNKQLELLMKQVMQQSSSTTDTAEEIQRTAKEAFGRQFESIVASGDFAYKINFASNFICKVETAGQYALAYGMPSAQLS